ncbi:MAG: EAL domain-containing protein [Gammaproteobacteria bacterium]|nr:EAL domain-containing protein [Gammaproteobacteria bacterium]
MIENLSQTQNMIIAGLVVLLSAQFMFLFLIVRHADKIIHRQEQQRSEHEDKIWHQAYYDPLTLLPNRVSFLEHIDEAITRARRHEKTGAIMFLDLDRFKLVNDSLGNDAGDQLLRATASRIRGSLRETDMVFRISGDEFIAIMEELDDSEGAALPAKRVLESMEQPVSLGEHEVIINLSIGITNFPKEGLTIDELVKEADSAMYSAKISGHNCFEFFSAEMNVACNERLIMTTKLQSALTNNEFVLYYQPKVDTHSRKLKSVEALLRWRHPEQDIVPPNLFIPVLEETGLINEVGSWVLLKACCQAQEWINAGLKSLRMSVNVSAIQFRNSSFLQIVKSALQKSGLNARYLELELTETMFIEDADYAIKMMCGLKSLGIYLSIDDFGAGYSSLSYLKQFLVDFLKIDKSFVRDLTKNKKDVAITSAIAGLAHSLNLKVIAEGVEDERQAQVLKEQGCHEFQGFLFSQPVPADELEIELLKLALKKSMRPISMSGAYYLTASISSLRLRVRCSSRVLHQWREYRNLPQSHCA